MCADASILATLVEAVIASVSMLGGAMAAFSGYWAALTYWPERTVTGLADEINSGIAVGFTWGAPMAASVAIIVFIF